MQNEDFKLESKLLNIINLTIEKYGNNHKITTYAAKIIAPYLSIEKRAITNDILNQSLSIDTDELLSLIEPERFEFERQKINPIEVLDEV